MLSGQRQRHNQLSEYQVLQILPVLGKSDAIMHVQRINAIMHGSYLRHATIKGVIQVTWSHACLRYHGTDGAWA